MRRAMADLLILRVLDGSSDGERILDEFEQRTELRGEAVGGERRYEIDAEHHRTRVVRTLTEIDPAWTDHLGFRLPG
jgi:hypothetical protein